MRALEREIGVWPRRRTAATARVCNEEIGSKAHASRRGRLAYESGSGYAGQILHQSYPVTDSSWSVGAWAPNVTSLGWQVLAFAICVRL
jgi:hypothetical protein